MADPAGKVVVVTGGTAGAGRAIAEAFAREGARVAVLARDPERLERTVRELESLGTQALGVRVDVADPHQVEGAAQQVEERLGPIDIWVNDAMTTVFAPFKDITPEDFRRVTEVTYLGFVYGTMAALRRMLPRDRGVIVQVGSALADRSIPLQSAYCGAKHGIRGFTDSIRCELIHDNSNVHITMVQMPGMNTPQFDWCKSQMPRRAQPVPPIYQPELAANAVLYAATHRRREIYVGLPTVEAIWGNKFIAGWLDRYLARTSYQAQQTAEPENPSRPNNLREPVRGDFGAHGRFDDKARRDSVQLWAAEHIGWYRAVAGLVTLGVAFAAGGAIASLCHDRREPRWHPRGKGRNCCWCRR
jgi:NAD(P)-dependent dehydrogenase (short-subunit alcohol dehydrogenase family)